MGDAGFILGVFVAATPFVLIIRKYVREAIRDETIWGFSSKNPHG